VLRDDSFCSHAIFDRKPLVVSNALMNKRFADNPCVTELSGGSLCAGHLLILSNGCCIGAFCILYTKPRYLDDAGLSLLRDIAQSPSRSWTRQESGIAEPKRKSVRGNLDPKVTAVIGDTYEWRSQCHYLISSRG